MPQNIAVFVKSNGILMPCKVFRQPDGAVWHCARCNFAVIRASFGILGGLWRCQCGLDVELCVDGVSIDIEAIQEQPQNVPADSQAAAPSNTFSDEDFLRGCGISPASAIEEN